METLDGDRAQSSFTVVSDAYRNENENNSCFLREDVFIDFNYLVTNLDNDEVKTESKEEISNSRDTSETESATEEVEEVDINVVGDDVIIFQSEDNIKEAYPNLQVYYDLQNIRQTSSVEDDLHSTSIKQEINYNRAHQEHSSVQGLTSLDREESEMKSEPNFLNKQDHSESTEPSYYYYIDSYPLTKNPPDSTDYLNNGESSIEGSYTVESSNCTQSALSGDILQIPKEEHNEIQQYAAEENENNIVIISMKKFVVDEIDELEKQPSNQLIKSLIPSRKWKRLYECAQCGKKFSHNVNLNIHMEVHTHELHPHKCVVCGVSFAKSRQLLRHLKKHTAPKKKILDCPICVATYKTYGHLRHHLIAVHGIENVNPDSNPRYAPKSSAQILIVKPKNNASSTTNPLNSIENLPDYFKSRESLIENNKTAEDLLKCPVCSKIYKSRGSFVKHVGLHNKEELSVNGMAACDDKTTIMFKIENKAHEIIHSREKLCLICGSSFKDFATLIKHKKANHRPFKCRKKFCKARFSHRHLLNRHLLESHLKTHLRRSFKCRTCESSFTAKSNYLHWRADFSSGMPYRCAECFSKIIAQSNLGRYRCSPMISERMKPTVKNLS